MGVSWLDRLRDGFTKTASRVGDNLSGVIASARRSPSAATSSSTNAGFGRSLPKR
jgi:hypothetical protein